MTAKIFCAIDTVHFDKAVNTALALGESVHGIKLGLEFFCAHGPQGIKEMRRICQDRALFLDLKLHDIPNTVAGAVRAVVPCEADFLTLHASGGQEMMKAAVDAAREESSKTGYRAPKILGVTVLTSFDEAALIAVGQETPVEKQVVRLAQQARQAGLAGLVCSPKEIEILRKELGQDMLLVVPGIRPSGAEIGDQKRVMTPRQASDAGADWLVIGRPITEASDPAQAAREILLSLK